MLRRKCSRKRDGYYLAELEKLIARYSSTTDARHMVARFESQHKESGQSEMRFCLARLTDFVYDKIARKRELAMADMVRLCQNALVIKDPIEQSEAVKSEIYYYFNAKYSRPQNNAIVDGGESMPACLPAERDSDIYEVTRRYIRFADGDTTGSFKNNLKHLRGAAQRTIRSYEHFTAAYFLRAYCLLIQSRETPNLRSNAIEDLRNGIRQLRVGKDTEAIIQFLDELKEAVRSRTGGINLDEAFEGLEDECHLLIHNSWLEQFSRKFLNTTDHAI